MIYLNKWQDNWNSSTKGRWTWDLVPKVNLNRILSNFYLNQVLSKHGVFPEFQSKRFGETDICLCNNTTGTLEHIIFECTPFEDIRNDYQFDVNYTIPFGVLLSSSRTTEGIRLIIEHFVKLALP